MRDLDLPDGRARELVHDRDREYTLRGSDTRALWTIGALRVVPGRDLHDPRDATFHERDGLRHLEKQGLIERVPLDGRDRAAVLTERGRGLLEGHRRRHDGDHRQAFYAGADRARERTHDAQLYRACLREAERLREQDARILRVQLDRELKRDYQRFLQERNQGDRDSDERPDRSREEIEEWAREHDLPYYDDQVHFPDVRIEYEDVDGDIRHRDIEVTTEHYRGGHASSASRSGVWAVGGRDLVARFKMMPGEREALVLVTIEDLAACRARILDERSAQFGLTPRERAVVELLCRGLQNKEISRELRVTGQTVKNHLKSITRRTGVEGRVALARLFLTEYPAGPPPGSPPARG